jgi:hypothetical protein
MWTSLYKGIAGDDLDIRDEWTLTNKAYGLVPHVKFTCDAKQSLCAGTDPATGTIAEIIFHKAVSGLAEDILRRPEPSRYTSLQGDQLAEIRDNHLKEALARVDALCANTDLAQAGGCFDCKSIGGTVSLRA